MEKTENDNTLHTVFKMSLNRRVDVILQIPKDTVLVFEQFALKAIYFTLPVMKLYMFCLKTYTFCLLLPISLSINRFFFHTNLLFIAMVVW